MLKDPQFNVKLFLLLTLSFILMTVTGTLTHELGHFTVAKWIGYESRINYGNTYSSDPVSEAWVHSISQKYEYELANNLPFPEIDLYDRTVKRREIYSLWILLGGPIQTMLTGSIGFILLLKYRRLFITKDRVHFKGWLLIFLSLFWLRQVANLCTGLAFNFSNGNALRSDEARIARHFDVNIWSIAVVTAIIGTIVLLKAFLLLPDKLKLTFLVSGLTGSILGYYLWLLKWGPIIIP